MSLHARLGHERNTACLRSCMGHRQTGSFRHGAGFTLIEILVVMVIVGIIVTLAAVRFGGSDQDALIREAERLSLLLEAARDEAIATGTTLGFDAEDQQYRFWQQGQDYTWQPLSGNDTLRPRELPVPVRLGDIRVNRQPLVAGQKVVFTPSGVNAPFEFTISAGAELRRLSADALGRVAVAAPGVSAP
ncbi:type II secretion system minor pseudopilin GspH [Chitinimonas sp. BJYL2]|uniref:type II secretion system minor pseudopilin GspH n=1 Tax=Chitinimonas sp. BJYL2 TaxID=2976696 RepID=UPI0022B57586|nr:type II secretion system minor pseudopilin GspH [Chitinimonas sp. BJYL2]